MCWDRHAICRKYASSRQKWQPSTMTDPINTGSFIAAHDSDQFMQKGSEICWIPSNLAGMSSLEAYPRAWRRAKYGKKGKAVKPGRNFNKLTNQTAAMPPRSTPGCKQAGNNL